MHELSADRVQDGGGDKVRWEAVMTHNTSDVTEAKCSSCEPLLNTVLKVST